MCSRLFLILFILYIKVNNIDKIPSLNIFNFYTNFKNILYILKILHIIVKFYLCINTNIIIKVVKKFNIFFLDSVYRIIFVSLNYSGFSLI